MKVILEIGSTKVLLPNCKNIDAFLATIQGAQFIEHQSVSNNRDYRDKLQRYESAQVVSRKSMRASVSVISDFEVKTADEWDAIVAEVKASELPEENGKEVLPRS